MAEVPVRPARCRGSQASTSTSLLEGAKLMEGVLLVIMPFCGPERPQIGVSTLKACLQRDGIPCDIAYMNIPFAERIGYDAYDGIAGHYSQALFGGEWVFARTLFSDDEIDYDGYLEGLRAEHGRYAPDLIRGLMQIAGQAEPFLEYCMRTIPWDRYALVGFTSTFEQNLASLALAKRVKERFPGKIVAMGGGNCEGVMGRQLHQSFPFLDFVFTGEADRSFPELVRRLAVGDPRRDDIAGCVYREGGRSVDTGQPVPVCELDVLPYPNYDDFFRQFRASNMPRYVMPTVQVETSRGCWWGAKNQCMFCGLNAESIKYRSKSPERALDEILHLVTRHGVRDVSAVDNVLDMGYFRDLLPELRWRRVNLSFFYEIKANLSREQVKLLSEVGIRMVQPGIESLHPKILRLMRKGVSPLQNIQLLKWCKEFGVRPSWNILYGFPGECAQDYAEMLPLMESLIHLPPPEATGQIRLDRFSPYFRDPEAYGFVNARPLPIYRHLYGLPEDEIANIAYFYGYEYADVLEPDTYIRPVVEQIARWREAAREGVSLGYYSTAPGVLVIEDTRPGAARRSTVLRGWQKTVYDFCDQARSLQAIQRTLGQDAAGDELRRFLDEAVGLRLMARDGNHYLSLALPVRVPVSLGLGRSLPYGPAVQVMPQALGR